MSSLAFRTGASVMGIALAFGVLVSSHSRASAMALSQQAQSSDLAGQGAELYQTRCATCHDHPQGSIPPLAALRIRSADYVLRVLTAGAMRQQASGLNVDQLRALVVHVTGRRPGEAPDVDVNANRCPPQVVRPLRLDGSSWNGWSGNGPVNARYQPNSSLTAATVPRLKLKWAFALPGGTAGATSQPTIVGGRVFIASASGILFALDAATGCTIWVQDLGVVSRNAIVIGKLGSGFAAYLGDERGEIHAIDADTGKALWQTRVEDHPAVHLSGALTLFGGRLYVPISSLEEAVAADPAYRCCTFRGSLAALDATTGRLLWKSYAIPQAPAPLANDPNHFAPAGAAIWTTPAVDSKRRLVYVGTGDAYTAPAAPESNAVIAFDMNTGERRWVHQVVANDTWLLGCDPTPGPNCPKGELGPDFDLSGSPLLATLPGGKQVLVASGKSGVAIGLDPDNAGRVLWRTQVAQGGTRGGIEWGGASDGQRIYFPISDGRDNVPFSTRLNASRPTPGGVSAVSVRDGKLLWHTPAPPPVCAWGQPCRSLQPSAPALIRGVVFAGSWDGHQRAYATADGRILWDFDTAGTFDGVNLAKVTGGSIDGSSQTVAGGMLSVNSGIRDRTGNALLAFTVDGR